MSSSNAPTHIVIYNSDGGAEKHTRANARDLVQHCGYSWLPNLKSAPNHPASYAGRPVPKGKTLPQEILDAATGDSEKEKADTSSAQRQIDAEVAEQAAQVAAMQAASKAASAPTPAEVADFTAPVVEEVDAELEAALEDDGEADAAAAEEAAGDEPALRPTRRTRVGRNS